MDQPKNLRGSTVTNKTPTFFNDFDEVNVICNYINEDSSMYESVQSQEHFNNSFEIQAISTKHYNTEEVTLKQPSSNDFRVSTVYFNYNEDELNLQYFIQEYMSIQVHSTHLKKNQNHFDTLIELQSFSIEKSPITSLKMSHDGHYITFGNDKGTVTVFEVLGYQQLNNNHHHNTKSVREELPFNKNLKSHLKFLNNTPIRKYNDHNGSITDLSWSYFHPNYLLTASTDGNVLLYDIKGNQIPIKAFKHSQSVLSIDLNPALLTSFTSSTTRNTQSILKNSAMTNNETFISACQNNHLYIWSLDNSNKSLSFLDIKERLSSIAFSPGGNMIILGTFTGKVMIYLYNNEMGTVSYTSSFSINDTFGLNNEQKVNNINFISKSKAYISTCDSRIRLVNFPDGKIIHKYKGHMNSSHINIQCDYNDHDDLLISGSEDGGVFIWNKESSMKKNYTYEMFSPGSRFNENKEYFYCVAFANELSTTVFSKRIYKLTTNLFIHSVIIVGSSLGNCQIFINLGNVNGAENRQYTLK